MTEKELRSALFYWYREAIKGNPAPISAISCAVETFYLFDLVSDDLYNLSCYLTDNLMEIEILDSKKDPVPVPDFPDELPFPDVVLAESEVLPFD